MKKNLMCLLLMVLLMVILAACNNAPGNTPNPSTSENGTAVNDTPSIEPTGNEASPKSDFAGQTLNISLSDHNYYSMEIPIERFKAAYPDVEVVVDLYEYGTYGQQVGLQLMAGDAGDILEPSLLDIRKVSETGLLADLYPLMQNDPDFHEEDYYMNVFDALSYKGKLSAFPISFTYNFVGINNLFSEQLTEQVGSCETITWRQVLDLYNNLEDKDGRYLCCSGDAESVFYDSFNSFIDFANKECYFDAPEFIRFLTDLKNSTSQKLSAFYKLEFDPTELPPDLAKHGVLEEYALQYLFLPLYEFKYREYLMFLPKAEQETFTHIIPVVTDTNELSIYAGSTYSISEASQNKELAWEFIKFITTPEANENILFHNMPVNKELFKAFTPANMMFFINQFQGAGMTIDGEAADVVTQVMAKLEPYNEMPMKCYTPGIGVERKIYIDDIIAFLDGALTAEQAASAIQNKVSLYLME